MSEIEMLRELSARQRSDSNAVNVLSEKI